MDMYEHTGSIQVSMLYKNHIKLPIFKFTFVAPTLHLDTFIWFFSEVWIFFQTLQHSYNHGRLSLSEQFIAEDYRAEKSAKDTKKASVHDW